MTTDTKTLNSVERRALEKLVKNDYETLSTELTVMYEQACEKAHKEHQATLDKTAAGRDAKAAKVRETLSRIVQKATADVEKIVSTAEREGFTVKLGGVFDRYGNPKAFSGFHATLEGIEDSKADKQLKSELDRLLRQYQMATFLMHRQELTVQRELLLTALTSDTAKEFLTAIPSARDLFVTAAIEA
jgi:hypothetical protein